MFRRLFIYLLILSALTSEGIINLPANLANYYYLYQGDTLISPGHEGVVQEQMQADRKPGAIIKRDYSSGLFVLSPESYSKFIAKAAVEYLCFSVGNTPENMPVSLPAVLVVKSDKDIILKISDSSPPFLIS